ncbi:Hint domain-containing protein [Thalassovita mangrovi]|uniref:Hedgehog/Intein (Hint) domain-containing protein n=1 Tax=Thalassovita mangrovi TaxID=2692236 RepID=A0A6L8LN52_9RHOB|nr:Hint domain-containing protein [Thalassovita mangrovi]MYM55082.1 hypothetical protein [Thalassovita mangrovi]
MPHDYPPPDSTQTTDSNVNSFAGFGPGQLTNANGGTSVGVGDTVVLDSSWSNSTDAYSFTFNDGGDTTLDGDSANNEVGNDSDQYLTVRDANGNVTGSGRGYLESCLTLSGPDGSTINVYTVEINGRFVGTIVDGDMTPGVHYEVTSVEDVNQYNAPNAAEIDSQTYESADANTINGSGGDESLSGGESNDTIYAAGGADTVSGDGGDDLIYSESGKDSVEGGSGQDTIYAGADNDTIDSGDGNDLVYGESGDDQIEGGTGNDTLYGGDGNDLITSSGSETTTTGSGGSSTSYTVINLGNVADLDPYEYGGQDHANYGAENWRAAVGSYGDESDPLNGRFAAMDAPNATSYVDGSWSVTTDSTGAPADAIYVNGVETYIDSVLVYDATITYEDGTTAPISAVVFQTVDGDLFLAPEMTYNSDQQALEAGPIQSISLNSLLSGNDPNTINTLAQSRWDAEFVEEEGTGEDGDDLLYGGAGDDTIYAGTGDDTLIGGSGADLLSGGDGHDVFSLEGQQSNAMLGTEPEGAAYVNTSGADTISDFDLGDDDLDGFTNDQLDVSTLRDANGETVETWDVSVGSDENGNAVLTFPNGEQIVLKGISAQSVSDPGQLYAMGIPCFVKGTLIETPDGAVPVERLRAGDEVVCADGSVLPITWAGGRVLGEAELQAHPQLRPVAIQFGSLGNRRELRLSPQHAVALDTPEGMRLARATHLAQREGGSFRVAHGMKSVSYHHLLLPRHALLLAEGAVVESMWPGPMAMAAVGPESRADILRHAPELKPALDGDMPVESLYGPRAAPVLSGREVRTMARIETPGMRRLQPAA